MYFIFLLRLPESLLLGYLVARYKCSRYFDTPGYLEGDDSSCRILLEYLQERITGKKRGGKGLGESKNYDFLV